MGRFLGKIETAATGAAGAVTGAALIYYLDRRAGRRRRARLRDAAVHAMKRSGEGLGWVLADLQGRGQGMLASLRHATAEERVENRVLAERVRSKLGRYVSHPHCVRVEANDGKVTLSGHILAREMRGLLSRLRRIRGITSLDNQLEVHPSAEGIPSLQGGTDRRHGTRHGWSPAARLAAFASALGLAAAGLRERGAPGLAMAAAGLGLGMRAWFNEPLLKIMGIGTGPVAVRMQKAINIDAPLDEVYRAFADYRNFPLFMPHVKEVRDLGEGRSHWKVEALAGMALEWNAEINELIADQTLGWRSLPGALVPNAGLIHFHANAKGGTTVDIKLGYHPPAGEIGHAFAKLLGVDPKRKLDEDLLTMKEMLERSHRAHSRPEPELAGA